jgi:hypothetical protein
MRVGILALFLALAGCVQGRPTPVEGAWQSNRDLTLAELHEARKFTPEQWRFLSDPTFFGQMVHIYRGSSGITVFEGKCSPPNAFRILDSQPGSVKLRYFDEFLGEERTTTLTVEGDRLYVPISMLEGQLRETFTRVPVEEVKQRHPCTRTFLEMRASRPTSR